MLAGLSVDYYTKLERGDLTGVSEQVPTSISRALRLDDAEREHLMDLARRANAGPIPRRRPRETRVRSSVVHVLDAIQDAPAWVRNGRYDILATNQLARALLMPALQYPTRQANLARFTFLDPAATTSWRDWEAVTSDSAAYLRAEAARNPDDKGLSDLVGELATRSDRFRQWWARHDVRFHRAGRKLMHHPAVGDLDLDFEAMELSSAPGLVLTIYTADPGSPSADALTVLANWAATQEAAAIVAPASR